MQAAAAPVVLRQSSQRLNHSRPASTMSRSSTANNVRRPSHASSHPRRRSTHVSVSTHNPSIIHVGHTPRSGPCPGQAKVKAVYNSTAVQIAVAVCIFLNFISSAVYAQLLPPRGTPTDVFFFWAEVVFMVIFSVELVVNMYSSWFLEFFKGPEDSFLNTWNLFDLVVVLVSGISLLFPDMPGISVLRLFRAFRVFRLFKRIPSLQRIVNGVFQSLPAVSNAFLVLLVIMGIWSIMGVEFFAEDMPDRFGTFMQAMLTMYQIMTLDGWGDLCRTLLYKRQNYVAPFFFVSYVFIASIVLANVVIAILLEHFLRNKDESEGQSEGQSEAAGGSEAGGDTGSQSANPLLGSRHSDSDSGDMSVLDSPRAGLFIMVPSVDSNNWTKAGGHHVEESTGGESRENQDRRASQMESQPIENFQDLVGSMLSRFESMDHKMMQAHHKLLQMLDHLESDAERQSRMNLCLT